jgi:hypothetical protein
MTKAQAIYELWADAREKESDERNYDLCLCECCWTRSGDLEWLLERTEKVMFDGVEQYIIERSIKKR